MPLIYDAINLHAFKNLPSNKCLAITLLIGILKFISVENIILFTFSSGDCVSVFSFFCAIILAVIDKRKYKSNASKNNFMK